MHDAQRIVVAAACAGLAACCAIAAAGTPPPDYDFQWAVIDHPGNPAYDGSLNPPGSPGMNVDRGSVAYDYRISKLELTSAQWLEFINIFAPQSSNPFSAFAPTFSGLQMTSLGQYRLNPSIPDAAHVPVFGITWREAAMYCNWLGNNKSHEASAILSGVYDASTFTTNLDGTFNDQATHSSNAQFWIPTLDEWIKAAHYDPNRFGSDQGGYWRYSQTSDDPPAPGAPGAPGAQTSAGYDGVADAEFRIPLGAYVDVRSPWGLLDTSGGTEEWTEQSRQAMFRGAEGASAGSDDLLLDQIAFTDYPLPALGASSYGLRIAGVVPEPQSFLGFIVLLGFRRKRRSWLAASIGVP